MTSFITVVRSSFSGVKVWFSVGMGGGDERLAATNCVSRLIRLLAEIRSAIAGGFRLAEPGGEC